MPLLGKIWGQIKTLKHNSTVLGLMTNEYSVFFFFFFVSASTSYAEIYTAFCIINTGSHRNALWSSVKHKTQLDECIVFSDQYRIWKLFLSGIVRA